METRQPKAPHKPLLLLYALGKWSTAKELLNGVIVKDVGALIEQFGGSAKVEVSNPFARPGMI